MSWVDISSLTLIRDAESGSPEVSSSTTRELSVEIASPRLFDPMLCLIGFQDWIFSHAAKTLLEPARCNVCSSTVWQALLSDAFIQPCTSPKTWKYDQEDEEENLVLFEGKISSVRRPHLTHGKEVRDCVRLSHGFVTNLTVWPQLERFRWRIRSMELTLQLNEATIAEVYCYWQQPHEPGPRINRYLSLLWKLREHLDIPTPKTEVYRYMP